MAKICPHKASCELFPHFRLKPALKYWQRRYCDSAFETCERFKRSAEDRPIPVTLLPNGKTLGEPLNS